MAEIANAHERVGALVLTGHMLDDYFIAMRERITRLDVPIFVTEPGSMNCLSMGAAGIAGNLAGVIPETYRRYMDAVEAGKLKEAASDYADIRRLMAFVSGWTGGVPRWVMMYLKAFKQPGGEGKLPDPYVHYDEGEYGRFTKGILALDIPDINGYARVAGLA